MSNISIVGSVTFGNSPVSAEAAFSWSDLRGERHSFPAPVDFCNATCQYLLGEDVAITYEASD